MAEWSFTNRESEKIGLISWFDLATILRYNHKRPAQKKNLVWFWRVDSAVLGDLPPKTKRLPSLVIVSPDFLQRFLFFSVWGGGEGIWYIPCVVFHAAIAWYKTCCLKYMYKNMYMYTCTVMYYTNRCVGIAWRFSVHMAVSWHDWSHNLPTFSHVPKYVGLWCWWLWYSLICCSMVVTKVRLMVDEQTLGTTCWLAWKHTTVQTCVMIIVFFCVFSLWLNTLMYFTPKKNLHVHMS